MRTSRKALAKSSLSTILFAPVMLLGRCRRAGVLQRYVFATVTLLVRGALLGVGTSELSLVHAETNIIPSVSVAESYDTNVYYSPKQFLPPGTQVWDFVTSLQGNVNLEHKGRDLEGSATAGGDLNGYAYNTGISYVSFRFNGDVNLDNWVQRVGQGAQLRLSERFRYTPESPGFLTGAKAGADDPFLRGIQGFRANTYSTTTRVRGTYPLYRGLGLEGSYQFSLFKVGSILASTSTGINYFNTTYHTFSAGPKLQLTPLDSIALLFTQSLIDQTSSTGTSPSVSTDVETASATYERVTDNWRFTVTGGATLVKEGRQTFPTGLIRVSNNPERLTTVQLDLSRQASPSLFFAAGALISNVGQIQITQQFTRRLNLWGNANYAFNEIVPTSNNSTFNNFSMSIGFGYDLTRAMKANIFYTHNDFKTDTPGLAYTLLRDVVGFGLTAEWK